MLRLYKAYELIMNRDVIKDNNTSCIGNNMHTYINKQKSMKIVKFKIKYDK